MFSDRHHIRPDPSRAAGCVWRSRTSLAGLVLGALLHAASPASAHEPYGAYLTPFGQPCCGEDDCAPLADGDVSRVRGGYFINSRREFVPQVDAQTGPDNRYHICTFQGLRMCFLIPPGPGA